MNTRCMNCCWRYDLSSKMSSTIKRSNRNIWKERKLTWSWTWQLSLGNPLRKHPPRLRLLLLLRILFHQQQPKLYLDQYWSNWTKICSGWSSSWRYDILANNNLCTSLGEKNSRTSPNSLRLRVRHHKLKVDEVLSDQHLEMDCQWTNSR